MDVGDPVGMANTLDSAEGLGLSAATGSSLALPDVDHDGVPVEAGVKSGGD